MHQGMFTRHRACGWCIFDVGQGRHLLGSSMSGRSSEPSILSTGCSFSMAGAAAACGCRHPFDSPTNFQCVQLNARRRRCHWPNGLAQNAPPPAQPRSRLASRPAPREIMHTASSAPWPPCFVAAAPAAAAAVAVTPAHVRGRASDAVQDTRSLAAGHGVDDWKNPASGACSAGAALVTTTMRAARAARALHRSVCMYMTLCTLYLKGL